MSLIQTLSTVNRQLRSTWKNGGAGTRFGMIAAGYVVGIPLVLGTVNTIGAIADAFSPAAAPEAAVAAVAPEPVAAPAPVAPVARPAIKSATDRYIDNSMMKAARNMLERCEAQYGVADPLAYAACQPQRDMVEAARNSF